MTESRTRKILSRFNRNRGATASAIEQFEAESGVQLPEDYAQFLRDTNGGEGPMGRDAYVMLWRVEELSSMNKAYMVTLYAPGLLLFGSDGGGEAFAFDLTTHGMPIVMVPFVG